MEKKFLPHRPKLVDFHGVPMCPFYISNWENIQNFQARPDDILIATYPRSGTTWTSYIVDLLHFGQTSPEDLKSVKIYDRVPFLELDIPVRDSGVEQANKHPFSPRIIKTHFPVEFVPKSFWEQNCKIIYVARNAKDNVVSYFNFGHLSALEPEPGDWSSFIHNFMDGRMSYGSWYDHVNDWWRKKQTYSNIHYLFYEDLVEDTGRELDKLCSFLGLSPSEDQQKWTADEVQFDKMTKNEMVNHSNFPIMDNKHYAFLRKGKVGDWKNHFTVAQSEEFDEDYKKKMKNSSVQFRTEI